MNKKCPYCEMMFCTKNQINTHIINCQNQNLIKCTNCDLKFKTTLACTIGE